MSRATTPTNSVSSRSTAANSTATPATAQRYSSFEALRQAHHQMLQQYREAKHKPALFDEIGQFVDRGRETGALIDQDDDRLATQSLLDYWASVLYRNANIPVETTLAEFDPQLAPSLEDADCPYLGLDAFKEANAHLFYGRQRLLNRLLKQLKGTSFLAVVGPSGSGKSSVVNGGLVPKLKAGALTGSESWIYYNALVPGSQPIESLARVLCPANQNVSTWLAKQVSKLSANPEYLSQLVAQRSEGRPSVLVVDQFEEVFTLCSDRALRQAFINSLVAWVKASSTENRLIVTMRSDFESAIARLPNFQSLFESAQMRVPPLEASELRQAIVLPASQVGLKFEEGLVEQLISDVLGEPAALPLLQFMLLKLWDRRDRNRVTWETYNRLGSARESLKVSADEFYEHLIREEKDSARRILLKMARPTAGLEITNNRIKRSELYRDGEACDRLNRVLQKLLDARLVRLTQGDTPEDDQIEIAHEALIRNWPKLIAWLEDERVNLRQRLRLTDRAKEWQQHGRPRDMLLTQQEILAETQRYTDLSPQEIDFIRRSKNKIKRRRNLRIASIATVILMQSIVSFVAIERATRVREALNKQKEATEEAKLAFAEQQRATNKAELALAAYEQAINKGKEDVAIIEQQQIELSELSSGASEQAQDGYQALLQGDMLRARNSFLEAQGYGNAAQLHSELLTEDFVFLYNNASGPTEKGELLRDVFKTILEDYSTNAPPNVLAQIRDRLQMDLIYYIKSEDNGEVKKILDNQLRILGFDPEIKSGTLPLATNAIWFGDQITLETVKIIATALIENDIPVQSIAPFRSSKPHVIEIGARSTSCSRNWTIEGLCCINKSSHSKGFSGRKVGKSSNSAFPEPETLI